MIGELFKLLFGGKGLGGFIETCCDEIDDEVQQIIEKEALLTRNGLIREQLNLQKLTTKLQQIRYFNAQLQNDQCEKTNSVSTAVHRGLLPEFLKLLFVFVYQIKPIFVAVSSLLIYDALVVESHEGRIPMEWRFEQIYRVFRAASQRVIYEGLEEAGVAGFSRSTNKVSAIGKADDFRDGASIDEYIN